MIIKETDFGATPEQLFAALHDQPYSFYLDSAQPAGGLGAYSFIGFNPFLIFQSRGDDIVIDRRERTEKLRGDPLAELRKLFQRYRSPASARLPFTGGAVGYFSYEFGLRFERIRRTSADDLALPEVEFGFYDALIAIEQGSGRTFVVANPLHRPDPEAIAGSFEQAVREALARRSSAPRGLLAAPASAEPRANFSRKDYLAAIARIKDYIGKGDVYQVNLSQRFETPLPCAPAELYQRLRRRNPAPFSAYLNFGSMQVVSSSPERFLRLRDGRMETRPIKGTRPRGADPAEDERRGQELFASAKDRAELLMIVDLERNDLGRVCAYGSIRVDDLCRLETHPTVLHLVATVSG
ncbi:MAG: anthranilate synthase component I family protein, partial [Opitutaceae bacterium]